MDLPLLHSPEIIPAPGGRFAWCAGRHLSSWLHRGCPAGAGWQWHDHEHHEVFWLLEGSLLHRDEAGCRRLEAGDCVFVAARHHHAATAAEGGARWININLQRADCEAHAHLRPQGWPWHGRLPLYCRPAGERLQLLAEELARLDPDSPVDRDWLILSCVRLADARCDSAHGPPPAWFSDGLHEILHGLPDARPGDLSRHTGRSQSQCNRMARRHYGCSCAALLIERRLELAAAALRTCDRPIATIAEEHGFSNLTDFYRRFHAHYGQRPAPYRDAAQRAH